VRNDIASGSNPSLGTACVTLSHRDIAEGLASERCSVNAQRVMTTLLTDLPPVLMLLIFIAIAVGIVLVVSWFYYDTFIAMAQRPPTPERNEGTGDKDTPPELVIPGTFDLWSRVLAFTTLAFVFMLAFVLNTFWGNVQSAQSATQSEAANLARLSSLALHISDPAGADALKNAITAYRDSVVNEEWPFLRAGDGSGASIAAIKSSNALLVAVLGAQAADKSSSPMWSGIESTLSDVGHDSASRIEVLPDSSAPTRVWTVIILGLAMLIMTTAVFPTRVKPYRVAISIMATLVALLIFVMVQASNPFAHHVTPEVFSMTIKTISK